MRKSFFFLLTLFGISLLFAAAFAAPTNVAAAGDSPLAQMNYQYQMNDGSSGQGTYWLYPGLRFLDESGRTGYWLFPPTNVPRFFFRYDPGMACDALSAGIYMQPHVYQGARLCRDGSGVYGSWTGVVIMSNSTIHEFNH